MTLSCLPRSIVQEREASTVVHRVPEYTGWGTQEDSLASCQSLVPKAPKTKFDIYGQRLSNRMFRAKGKFDPDTVCYQVSRNSASVSAKVFH